MSVGYIVSHDLCLAVYITLVFGSSDVTRLLSFVYFACIAIDRLIRKANLHRHCESKKHIYDSCNVARMHPWSNTSICNSDV